jgi:uncharacterized protein YegP (UPF0339 family)
MAAPRTLSNQTIVLRSTRVIKDTFIKLRAYTYRAMAMLMSAMPKFEIYKDSSGKFRWRLKAANNEIIAVGEAYESKDGCKNSIQSVKTNAPRAEIRDIAQ